VVDMIDTYIVEEFIYTGRGDGDNGRIKEFEVYFSNDPDKWDSPAISGYHYNSLISSLFL
jgi:beta-galactosidase